MTAQFPNIPKDVFLAQYSKPLDILIGSDAPSLLPKCIYGPECKDCEAGLCCYQSKFRLGWFPVGQCKRNLSNKVSCPTSFSIFLQRVIPQKQESFFFWKDSESDPIPSYKLRVKVSKFCYHKDIYVWYSKRFKS